MQREYFVDTWFFIAFTDPRDAHHRNARRLRAATGRADLVTHDGVLTELLTFFADALPAGRLAAVQIVRRAFVEMEVVHITRSTFDAAVALYERRPDKEYSLVDCMSMHLMRARGITHILTNDHHFRQEGFTVVSDAS